MVLGTLELAVLARAYRKTIGQAFQPARTAGKAVLRLSPDRL